MHLLESADHLKQRAKMLCVHGMQLISRNNLGNVEVDPGSPTRFHRLNIQVALWFAVPHLCKEALPPLVFIDTIWLTFIDNRLSQ